MPQPGGPAGPAVFQLSAVVPRGHRLPDRGTVSTRVVLLTQPCMAGGDGAGARRTRRPHRSSAASRRRARWRLLAAACLRRAWRSGRLAVSGVEDMTTGHGDEHCRRRHEPRRFPRGFVRKFRPHFFVTSDRARLGASGLPGSAWARQVRRVVDEDGLPTLVTLPAQFRRERNVPEPGFRMVGYMRAAQPVMKENQLTLTKFLGRGLAKVT